jgi:endonuclease/exonuclease/phosphatase (EEP) superfamily protein YafD
MAMEKKFRISKSLSLISILFSSYVYALPYYHFPVPTDNDILYTLGIPSARTLSRHMSILVWNLHKGSNDTFSKDFNELSTKKDLILGQEMELDPNMRIIFGANPNFSYSTATSFFIGKELYRTGVATGSPATPVLSDYVRTQVLEPVVNSPKVTLITHYPIRFSNKELTVVNIHGINFVDAASYKIEMDRLYAALKNIPSPMIFAGDFNSWSDERDAILLEMIRKLNLKEANFFPDNRLRFHKHPLDHFFYTNDLQVLDAKVESFYQGSDHKPLELEVEYSPFKK